MNNADSMQVSALLEHLGYQPSPTATEADVIVLNTCVVRQSAEDKAIGRLTSLKAIKAERPEVVINLMGCLVGMNVPDELRKRFPYVDVFSPPSDVEPLSSFLTHDSKHQLALDKNQVNQILLKEKRYQLPASQQGKAVTAFVPIVYGCSHACTYCVIPLRRGQEQSRPVEEILSEVRHLASQGVREVTLLGQIVDRYGLDLPDKPNLSQLLELVHQIDGLERIRFLTSHPLWITEDLLESVTSLPKLMPHFELPIQSGDDEILRRMRRGYTVERFMQIVEKIRTRIPESSIATDLIVGFPGESRAQFENTLSLLNHFKPDMTHVARYSSRPGTYASCELTDDVPAEEKMHRFRQIEQAQQIITTEINHVYLNQKVSVLFEDKAKNRWHGRTPTNKLVFVESERDLLGEVADVYILWAGPWSMIGSVQ